MATASSRPAAASAWAPARRRRSVRCRAASDDEGLAVLRFTLGSDEVDNAVPRVVGAAGAALLAANHALAGAVDDAQGRAEAVGVVLSALCIAAPAVGARLEEVARGVRRKTAAVEGAAEVFELAEGLPGGARNELAWASAALLRNTPARAVVVTRGGRVALARGALAAGADVAGAVTGALSAPAWRRGAYLAERPDVRRDAPWAFVPAGAEALLVAPLPGGEAEGDALVLLSDAPRAFSERNRAWASALAEKLGEALPRAW